MVVIVVVVVVTVIVVVVVVVVVLSSSSTSGSNSRSGSKLFDCRYSFTNQTKSNSRGYQVEFEENLVKTASAVITVTSAAGFTPAVKVAVRQAALDLFTRATIAPLNETLSAITALNELKKQKVLKVGVDELSQMNPSTAFGGS